MRSNAAALRHRVTVQQQQDTRDAFGQKQLSWSTVFATYASVTPIRAGEFFSALQTEHEITHRVLMRYDSRIEPHMRIRHDSRVLSIDAVRNVDERDQWLELMCSEGPKDSGVAS